MNLPPLSLSILGVEPLDEFIKEIGDFVHHMIMTNMSRINEMPPGTCVEVEAKVGVIKEKVSGQRVALPVLVETSMCVLFFHGPARQLCKGGIKLKLTVTFSSFAAGFDRLSVRV